MAVLKLRGKVYAGNTDWGIPVNGCEIKSWGCISVLRDEVLIEKRDGRLKKIHI